MSVVLIDRLSCRERFLEKESNDLKRKGSSFQKILEKASEKKEASVKEMTKARGDALTTKGEKVKRAGFYQEHRMRLEHCLAQAKKGKKKATEAEAKLQAVIKNLKLVQGKVKAVQHKRQEVEQTVAAQKEAIHGVENADLFLVQRGETLLEGEVKLEVKEQDFVELDSEQLSLEESVRRASESEVQEPRFEVVCEQGESRRESSSHLHENAGEQMQHQPNEQQRSYDTPTEQYESSGGSLLDSYAQQIEHFVHESTPFGERLNLHIQLAGGKRVRFNIEKRKGQEISVSLTADSIQTRGELLALEKSIRKELVERGFRISQFSISLHRNAA